MIGDVKLSAAGLQNVIQSKKAEKKKSSKQKYKKIVLLVNLNIFKFL